MHAAKGLEFDHVYVLGLMAARMPGPRRRALEPIPDALIKEALPPDSKAAHVGEMRRLLHVAMTRARRRLVLAYPEVTERGAAQPPSPFAEEARAAVGGEWEAREEELFGPAETLQSTFRLLRDELLTTVAQVGGRLGELRFDTDLDVSHAVVRYLEVLKLVGADGAHARRRCRSPRRCRRSTRGCCRRSRPSSARSSRRRRSTSTCSTPSATRSCARGRSRSAPSRRSSSSCRAAATGWCCSASDIETYRTCPLKYKFARVFRIPSGADAQPALRDPRPPGARALPPRAAAPAGSLPELLGLLEAGWRRGGFGDSEEERQLRAKATQALLRYHERFQGEDAEPVWFERSFSFTLGPHLLRGRVDRVDRLPDGGYELIDYKTGPAEVGDAAARGRPALALRGRRARVVAARGRPPGLLLRARRREGAGRARRPRTATGSPTRSSRSPTASSARASSRRRRGRRARCATTGSPARRRRSSGGALARRHGQRAGGGRDPRPARCRPPRSRRRGRAAAGAHRSCDPSPRRPA